VVIKITKVPQSYGVMVFDIEKMRHAPDELRIISKMDWNTLQIGPETGELPEPDEDDDEEGERPMKIGPKHRKQKAATGESIYDDDPPF
jgi:hypothetical protein